MFVVVRTEMVQQDGKIRLKDIGIVQEFLRRINVVGPFFFFSCLNV